LSCSRQLSSAYIPPITIEPAMKLKTIILSLLFPITIQLVSVTYAETPPFLFAVGKLTATRGVSQEEKSNGVMARSKVSLNRSVLRKKRFPVNLENEVLWAERSRSSSSVNYPANKEGQKPEVHFGRLYRKSSTDDRTEKAGEYALASVTDSRNNSSAVVASFQLYGGKRYSIVGKIKGSKQQLTLRKFGKPVNSNCHPDPFESFPNGGTPNPTPPEITPPPPATPKDRAKIKMLVAYTQGAVKKYGGDHSLVGAYVAYEMARLKQAFENSGIDAIIDPACAPYFLEQEGPKDIVAVHTAAVTKGDGIWDSLHEKRIECQADIVKVLTWGVGGLGYIPRTDSAEWGRNAYNVSDVNYYVDPGSAIFAHEIGHNFGAVHTFDPAYPSELQQGRFSDSYGYRFTGSDNKLYRDIMAYIPGDLWLGFGNPEKTYLGTPAGKLNESNAARTLNHMAPIVATFSDYLVPPEGSISFEFIRFANDPYTHARVKLNMTNNAPLGGQNLVLWSIGQTGKLGSSNSTPATTEPITFSESIYSTTYFASLNPDRNISSEQVYLPPLILAKMKLELSGSELKGTIKSGESPVSIGGQWIEIFHKQSEDAQPQSIGFVGPNSAGEFSLPLTLPGTYVASIQFDNFGSIQTRTSNSILYTLANP